MLRKQHDILNATKWNIIQQNKVKYNMLKRNAIQKYNIIQQNKIR